MFMTVLKMDNKSILKATHLLDINSTNAIHKWICYQQQSSRQDDSLLYRVKKTNNAIFLYIQSNTKFNISRVHEAGFEAILQFDIDENYDFLSLNDFDVQCFPNRCDSKTQKRFFLKSAEERVNWLKTQFEKNGIQILDCREYKNSNIYMDKYSDVKLIKTSSFEGKMKIVDGKKAHEFLKKGLGRFKNYGLGLVLVSQR